MGELIVPSPGLRHADNKDMYMDMDTEHPTCYPTHQENMFAPTNKLHCVVAIVNLKTK